MCLRWVGPWPTVPRTLMGYPNYTIWADGRVESLTRRCFVRFDVDDRGRKRVTLYHKGRHRRFRLSRLILEVFVGPCPDGMECCHDDGNETNDTLTNLRWDTPLNNHADRFTHSTVPMGETHSLAKLTNEDVVAIRGKCEGGVHQREIAATFGISQSQVGRIVRRESWKHV